MLLGLGALVMMGHDGALAMARGRAHARHAKAADNRKKKHKHNGRSTPVLVPTPSAPQPIVEPAPAPIVVPDPAPEPAPVLADPTPMLAALAALQTHGYDEDGTPLDRLEAKLANGERIVVSCGTIARLGVRALTRGGYTARLVGGLTKDPYTGNDDGHIMLEVLVNGGWRVYDLDLNHTSDRSIVDLVASHPRSWSVIANDPLFVDNPDPAYQAWLDQWATNLDGWYDHILGIPTICYQGYWWFRDDGERSRAESLGFQYANAELWQTLLAPPP